MWIHQRAEPLIGYDEAHGGTARPLQADLDAWGAGVY
jgi:hypothetical protein